MTTQNKRFRIEYVRHGRANWRTIFHIDQQGFTVCSGRTKKEAYWYGKCLRHCFKKLEFINPNVTI